MVRRVVDDRFFHLHEDVGCSALVAFGAGAEVEKAARRAECSTGRERRLAKMADMLDVIAVVVYFKLMYFFQCSSLMSIRLLALSWVSLSLYIVQMLPSLTPYT